MAVPVQLPTAAREETYGGVTYHIEGELVPALHIELTTVPVYFEHHVLLWKDPAVQIGIKPLKGAFKARAHRLQPGRGGPGLCPSPPHRRGGRRAGAPVSRRDESRRLHVTRVKGAANVLFGGTGFFIDTFTSLAQEGILWLHGYGNVFEVVLKPGEQIDIEPGGWIYKDRVVKMETIFQRVTTGLFASAGQLFWNRFTGPGRVALQSMYIHLPTE